VGILHSDYAAYYTDACENSGVSNFKRSPELASSYNVALCETYRQLLDMGYNVSVVTADALSENKFGVKVLYVPKISALSPEELEAVRAFRRSGGRVFENTYSASFTSAIGYKEFDEVERRYEDTVYIVARTIPDVADATGIYPSATPITRGVGTRMLEGEGCKLLFLVNTQIDRHEVDTVVELGIPFNSIECIAADGEKKLSVNGNTVTVKIGEVTHPMLPEHHIEWILLETKKGFQIKYLSAGDAPEAKFELSDDEAVAVYEYCNLHGLWKKEL
jgi:desulfoferrodoxin-like iron-binding protein